MSHRLIVQQLFIKFSLNFITFYEFHGPRYSFVMNDKQLTCSLADKCNKDQLKTYPPEDDLIKRPKHVVVNKQRN
jgi:hypothetical protein